MLTDLDLLYAATARCEECGAGLAYRDWNLGDPRSQFPQAWECSKVLKGEAMRDLEHKSFPFAFWKIREETSINNRDGATTRPPGTIALTVGKATCPQCEHTWESEPYSACGASHHWFSGPCPECGYAVGGAGTHSSDEGPPIEHRYRNVCEPAVRGEAKGDSE